MSFARAAAEPVSFPGLGKEENNGVDIVNETAWRASSSSSSSSSSSLSGDTCLEREKRAFFFSSSRDGFRHFDMERTAFIERVFLLLDADRSGNLNFAEFVGALYVYCTFSWAGLVQYAFELTDLDSSGVLELAEIDTLVRTSAAYPKFIFPYRESILTRERERDARLGNEFSPPTRQMKRKSFEARCKSTHFEHRLGVRSVA